jgi:ClpP class serine protease
MANVIRILADNEKVKSIVLNIDSPGGSVDGTVDVGAAVEYAKSKKNVIAYVDGLCASASYRIAVNANSIIAKQGSIIGSIGTMYQLVDDTEAQQKRGYKLITINADASSEKNLAVDLAKNGDASVLKKELLNPINNLFLADVRKARPQVNESALKGSTYISSKAKSLGLIDEEALLPDIIASELNKSKKSSMKFFNKLAQFLGLEQMSEQTQLNAEQLEKLEGMQEMHLNAIAEREATIEQQLNTIQSKENEIEDLKQELETLKQAPGVLPTQTKGESTAIKKDFSHVKEPGIKEFFEKTFNN